MTFWAIESVTDHHSRRDAEIVLETLQEQEDFLGGRILGEDDCPHVQAFFRDMPEAGEWLPFGMERVAVPAALRGLLRFPVDARVDARVDDPVDDPVDIDDQVWPEEQDSIGEDLMTEMEREDVDEGGLTEMEREQWAKGLELADVARRSMTVQKCNCNRMWALVLFLLGLFVFVTVFATLTMGTAT